MMIGMWRLPPSSARIRSATAYPSSLGRLTSSRIRLGDSDCQSFSASCPSPATTTV